MRKILILAFSLLLGIYAQAGEIIHFNVSIFDDMPIGNGHGKPSIEVPKVYIEDYTLSFGVNHPEYILIIKDEDDNVVYTTTVYSTQTDVILPSTLSGNYEINLVMGNWLFTGWINL